MSQVLVCIDFSDASAVVVRRAATLAQALGEDLHLLHVAADEPVIAGYDKDQLGTFRREDRARQLLDEHHELRDLAAELESSGLTVVPMLEMGSTVDTILEAAERIDAELIAIGSHGHGAMHHLLAGSVTTALLKASTRPLLVVPIRP